MHLLTTSLGRFRLLGIVEGLSLLVLLGVAMPLKYWAGDPTWVRVVGMAHGVLFVLFLLGTVQMALANKWKFWPTTVLVMAGATLPFGSFWVDARILAKLPPQQ